MRMLYQSHPRLEVWHYLRTLLVNFVETLKISSLFRPSRPFVLLNIFTQYEM